MIQEKILTILSNYWFLVRYGIVGVCGGLIQMGTLYLWVGVFHLQSQYLFGAIVGFCLALLVTFTFQKYWTFRDFVHTKLKGQLFFYTFIALINLGLTVLFLHLSKMILESLGFDFFHIAYLIVQAVIIAFLAVASFISNYFLTFRTREHS